MWISTDGTPRTPPTAPGGNQDLAGPTGLSSSLPWSRWKILERPSKWWCDDARSWLPASCPFVVCMRHASDSHMLPTRYHLFKWYLSLCERFHNWSPSWSSRETTAIGRERRFSGWALRHIESILDDPFLDVNCVGINFVTGSRLDWYIYFCV